MSTASASAEGQVKAECGEDLVLCSEMKGKDVVRKRSCVREDLEVRTKGGAFSEREQSS